MTVVETVANWSEYERGFSSRELKKFISIRFFPLVALVFHLV